jgi:hypothetical protein
MEFPNQCRHIERKTKQSAQSISEAWNDLLPNLISAYQGKLVPFLGALFAARHFRAFR